VELVTRSYNSNEYWVEAIVGDDDSTSCAALTTDLKLYQAAHPDEPKANYWPRNDDGKFLPSKGKLHWDVQGPTTFLCDPNHRQRVVGGHIFGMAAQTAKTRVTKADAERLKCNLGYAHKQSVNKPFDEYRKAMKAALLHHGNDHSCCDPAWCAFARGAKDVNENKKYLIIRTQRWNNLKSVFDTYTTDEMLRMTYHPFDSQKNESLNTKIAAVAPKTKTFCSTMSLSDRVAFVVITDSIGYEAGISRILSKLAGEEAPTIPTTLQVWMRQADAETRRRKVHRDKPETKKKRAKEKQEKIKKCIADDKKARIRGLDYGTGIAVQEEAAAAAAAATAEMMMTTKTKVICNRCGEE